MQFPCWRWVRPPLTQHELGPRSQKRAGQGRTGRGGAAGAGPLCVGQTTKQDIVNRQLPVTAIETSVRGAETQSLDAISCILFFICSQFDFYNSNNMKAKTKRKNVNSCVLLTTCFMWQSPKDSTTTITKGNNCLKCVLGVCVRVCSFLLVIVALNRCKCCN